MQKNYYIVYFNDKETASSTTHKAINKQCVDLSKSVLVLDGGKWMEKNMNNVCPLIKEWKVEKLNIGKNGFY